MTTAETYAMAAVIIVSIIPIVALLILEPQARKWEKEKKDRRQLIANRRSLEAWQAYKERENAS